MRIGIVVELSNGMAGVEYYTYNLIKGIINIDFTNQYFIYSAQKLYEDFPASPNLRKRESSFSHRLLWHQFHLPFLASKDKVDLVHTSFLCPLFSPIPSIITIHDMTVFIFPHKHEARNRLIQRFLLPLVVRKAKKIIAVSQSTKQDIVRFFKIPEDKIRVIYEGIDPGFFLIRDYGLIDQVKKKHGILGEYILYVGTLEPRKNIVRLIKAFGALKKMGQIKHKLVIVGKKGWLFEDIFETINSLNLKEEVIFTGYVPRNELNILYNAADLFVYPSLYEGFGFPPVEAMACGTPVVTSNNSSLPEVVGDAAIKVNPYKEREISEAIYEIISNKKKKEELIKRGLERVKHFSWNRAAEETLEVYLEVFMKRVNRRDIQP